MSSPPPPPSNPTTTAAATATATATADFFKSVARQRPRKHLPPAIYQTFYNPQPATFPPPTQRQPQQHSNLRTHHQQSAANATPIYPVASSGRGVLSKHQQPISDHNAPDAFPPRPVSAYPYAVHRPYGFSNSDVLAHQLPTSSSAHVQQAFMGGARVMPTTATGVSVSANPKGIGSRKGVAKRLFIDLNEKPQDEETANPDDQPKGSTLALLHSCVDLGFYEADTTVLKQKDMVAGQSAIADGNSLKNIRDKNGDDTFVIIRDRKVQVSEGTSLYAQCRSWLKNGFTLENQPQYVDCLKSLPKPLPASTTEARKEDDMEIEEKIGSVEQLSVKELLQVHVNHAKKVRVRLRNQRLQRIERYKDRLALLLPPVVDQQPKNDPAP